MIEEAEKLASSNEMKMAIARVKEIYEAIEKLGYGSYISIDLGMIQHLDYYTGVIFKGYIYEIGEEIVSGGRYDELIGNFGDAAGCWTRGASQSNCEGAARAARTI